MTLHCFIFILQYDVKQLIKYLNCIQESRIFSIVISLKRVRKRQISTRTNIERGEL